jgi:PAS domain S-box-containing protein
MIQKNINKLFRRKEAEDKLRHREHRYRIMIESNPLGVFLMDHEGVIQDCNDAFVELMGSSREKLIGFNATESTTPEMQQVIKKALAGEVGIFEGEYTSITGSKTAHLRIVYNPVNPGGNSPTDIIATVEDVSARKRAEEETRTASERMKAIFSSIKDPILVHPYTSNGHGIFSEVNDIACTRYGYTRDEFLQISVKNLLKQDSGESLLAPGRLEEIMTKGHMVFETVHVTKNGEEFPVEVSVCTMDQAEKKICPGCRS